MKLFKRNKGKVVSYIPVLINDNTEVLFVPVYSKYMKKAEKLAKKCNK